MVENTQCVGCRQQYISQTKLVALRVHEYLQRRHPSLNEGKLKQETSVATGIPMHSLQCFKREAKEDGVSSPPSKRRKTRPVQNSVDSFDETCIRNVIASFYGRGEVPTLNAILEKVKEPLINFKGQRTSFYKLMKTMGFRFRKTDKGRRILMERDDIVVTRVRYLRKIEENRNSSNPRPEIYIDETWVHQNECVDKCWTDSEGKFGLKVKSGRGARFIVVHAGGEDGFVPGGLHVQIAKWEQRGLS